MARVKVKLGPHRPTSLSHALAPYSDIWGVYVGDGCVTGTEPLEWLKIHAHAHNDTEDEWFGWICIADPYNVITAKGNPTAILLHEVAHVLCRDPGHSQKWCAVVSAIGAPGQAQKYGRQSNGKPSKE